VMIRAVKYTLRAEAGQYREPSGNRIADGSLLYF